jgi:GDPmannose 4,6-dehydratase
VAKLYAHWLTINYRESHKLWACAGLCFNHESFRRGSEFVTQKIAQGAAACAAGVLSKLRLGNLEARRDWGHAADFVRAMWLMLQQEEPDEYVIGTGEEHSVREFAELAFRRVGLDYKEFVEVDERHYRPAEVNVLRADYSKARRVLGWEPKMSFEALVNEMVDHAMGHPGEWR